MEWHHIPGWFDKADSAIYEKWARECPPDCTIVEVGSYAGRSTACLLTHLDANGKPEVKVISVDLYLSSRPGLACWYLERWQNRVHIVQDSSDGYARRFADGSLWGVYIDTYHKREHILRDVNAWLAKVAKGGRIGGHDYSDYWPELKGYIVERFPVHNVYGASWEVEL